MHEDQLRREPPAGTSHEARPRRLPFAPGLAAVQRSAGNAAVSLLLASTVTNRPEGARVVAQRLTVRADPTQATITAADPVIGTLVIDGDRPPTGLVNAKGQPVQGDHTTAWALIKAEVVQAVQGNKLSAAFTKLKQAVEVWRVHGWADALLKSWSDPQPGNVYTLQNVKQLETYVETYLQGRNRQPGAAYLRQHPKQPKAAAATGSQGERTAMIKLAQHKTHMDFTSTQLVGVVVDLFDPPFTGKLQQQGVDFFFDTDLAPRLADQIMSAVMAIGSAGSAAWNDQGLDTFVTNVVKAVLADMDQQGIYGVHLSNATNQKSLVKKVAGMIPWNDLNYVVNVNPK